MASNFRGDWAFLSNFYECKIVYEGYTFNNAESAFQAQKCISEVDKFIGIDGLTAKKLGRKVTLRSDWDKVKDDIMYKVVFAKFEQNPELRDKLIKTYPFEIVERNTWGDTYWGVCNGRGLNKLGKILEKVSDYFRTGGDKKMFKVIIAGGREFNDYNLMCKKVDRILSNKNTSEIEIISGNARGADKLGEKYAKDNNISLMCFPADWNKYGKRAGYIRNEQMAKEANALIAFWDGKSKGTKHMIDIARSKGLLIRVIKY